MIVVKTMNEFGGKWTTEKLNLIRKYLKAYSTIMNKKKFNFAYIDAFAGSGYYRKIDNHNRSLFMPEFGSEEKLFLDGSARIALGVTPSFQQYIFIEKDKNRVNNLEKLKDEFPDKAKNILVINEKSKKYQKIADFNKISSYFSERLDTIFKGVASNPRPLYNSTNNPLFLLFFAAGNERGASTAIKIANQILKSK
jgi:hypothetical protein